MSHFNIDYTTDRPDHLAVELDRRFDVMLIRTDAGLEIRVYPRTEEDCGMNRSLSLRSMSGKSSRLRRQ